MEKFNEAASSLSGQLQTVLYNLDDNVKSKTYEIRLRSGRPIMLYGIYGKGFLTRDSHFSKELTAECRICELDELRESFNRICGYSIHAHQSSINGGFVTMKGGHRAGVVGTAVCDRDDNIVSIKDVSSLNIRIAREIKSCAEGLADKLFKGAAKSLIIAGPPASGKTTVLRDLIRILAGGDEKFNYKVAVIDEREEIASMCGGAVLNDLGINCDILNSYPKKKAVMLAVKTMSPQIIALDEVATDEEITAIEQAVNSGVRFILTLHAASFDELVTRPQVERLINTYSFDNVCLLCAGKVCTIKQIYDAGEIRDEIFIRRYHSGLAQPCRSGSKPEDA